jgi:hypothetical protein
VQRVCEKLETYINGDLLPFLESARTVYEREGDDSRVLAIDDLRQTLAEIVEDIRGHIMDEWECGELYEEFRKYRESGEFLDKIL